MGDNKFYLEAPIKIQEETAARKEKASNVIELPTENQKQPDLLYFSAIFVSSGENLNHAYFLGSELVMAEGSIINKALDIEHNEDEVVGHIYERVYIDKEGNPLSTSELASRETASLDSQDMHIAIAGIIYKNRFSNLSKEVADGKFCVSMECYYHDYDVKVGDTILSRRDAEVMGLASLSDDALGRMAKLIKNGKEIAKGTVARVLRNISFSGCGIVKNPANPASVIMETAKDKTIEKSDKLTDEVIILDYDKLKNSNNVTSGKVEDTVTTEKAKDGALDDSVGICVNYKRFMHDKAGEVTAKDWCTAYEAPCASFSRDTTDPDCLLVQDVRRIATAALEEILRGRATCDKRDELLEGLKAALAEAVKTQSL